MANKDPLNEMKKLAGLQLNEFNIAEAPKKSAAPADDGRQYYRDPGDGGPVVPLGTKSQAGPGLYGDEKGRFDKMPGDNTRFFSTPGPETAKPAPAAPAPAAKAPVVTKDQLDQFRKEVGNPNATLGQYMNQQKGLTARKGGANDPDVIQKNLNPDQQAYRPAAPTQPATPAPAKPAPAPATPSPTAPGGQFGPGSTTGMTPPAANIPPNQMSRPDPAQLKQPGAPEPGTPPREKPLLTINEPIPGFGPGAKPVPPPTGTAPIAPIKPNPYDWGGGSSDGPAPKMKNPPSNPVSVPQAGRQDPYSMGGGLDAPPPPPPTTVPQAGRRDPYSMGGGRDAPKADVPKFMQTPDGPAPKMSTPPAAPKSAPELNMPVIPGRINPDPYTLQGTGTKTMWDSNDHPGEEMVSDDIARLKTLSGIQEGPGDMAPDSGGTSTKDEAEPTPYDRAAMAAPGSKVDRDNAGLSSDIANLGTQYGITYNPIRPVHAKYAKSTDDTYYSKVLDKLKALSGIQGPPDQENYLPPMPPNSGIPQMSPDSGPAPMPDARQFFQKNESDQPSPSDRPASFDNQSRRIADPFVSQPSQADRPASFDNQSRRIADPFVSQPSQADREGLNKMFSNTAFTDKTGNVPLPPRRPADLGADTSPAVKDSYTDRKGNQHYVPNAPAYNADKKERDNVIKKMPPGIGMTTIESADAVAESSIEKIAWLAGLR